MINKTLRHLFFYNGIFVLAGSLLGPLYAVYVQEINNAPEVISISWSIFLISGTIFMTAVARFGDRVKRKGYFLVAGYLIRALVWILYIYADSVLALFALQVLHGLGEAFGGPAYNASVAEHLDKSKHLEDYSDQIIFFNMTSALGTVLGGFILALFSFQILFLSMAFLALISSIGVLYKLKRL